PDGARRTSRLPRRAARRRRGEQSGPEKATMASLTGRPRCVDDERDRLVAHLHSGPFDRDDLVGEVATARHWPREVDLRGHLVAGRSCTGRLARVEVVRAATDRTPLAEALPAHVGER